MYDDLLMCHDYHLHHWHKIMSVYVLCVTYVISVCIDVHFIVLGYMHRTVSSCRASEIGLHASVYMSHVFDSEQTEHTVPFSFNGPPLTSG